MHSLKEIRKNFESFKKKIKERNVNINFETLSSLDKQNREFIQKKEKLEQEIKIIKILKNPKKYHQK